jgi:hypothetical protein
VCGLRVNVAAVDPQGRRAEEAFGLGGLVVVDAAQPDRAGDRVDAVCRRAVRPATDEMLTMSPPPSLSWSRKTSVAVIAPSTLTSIICR